MPAQLGRCQEYLTSNPLTLKSTQMDLIDQILNQARNFLVCPACGGHFDLGSIRLRGFIDNTYIFQAYCANGHDPLAVTYLASLRRLEKPISAYFYPLSGKEIDLKAVKSAESELNTFNGDFRSLWKK